MAYPSKPIQTDLPLLDAIKVRWSPRAFSAQPVEQEKIHALFEAARWAPSCFNEQPWRYVYAGKDDGPSRAALESLLTEGNAWAKEAYLLVIGFGKTTFAHNGKENRYHLYDLGCATGFLALQLPSLGLIGHQMAGFARDKANAALGVPDGYVPGSMIAIGYPGDPARLPEEQRAKEAAPRVRNDWQSFAFRGGWEAGNAPRR
jgi:nitroreductase